MSALSVAAENAPDTDHGRVIRSGIAPLDEHLGGIAAGRIHLLSGDVGVGKTTACLHFLVAGLRSGQRAAILTLDEPYELGAHATFLGIDLAGPVRRGQLTALRFRPAFSRRFTIAHSYRRIADDLRAMMGTSAPPARVVIDPISPFLSDGSPSGGGIALLVELLEALGATSLLTVGNALTPVADRRLDPLTDRAATIASLERDSSGAHRMIVSRARPAGAPTGPLPFPIGPVPGDTEVHRRGGPRPAPLSPASTSARHRLLVIPADEAGALEGMLALLRREYDVRIERSLASAQAAYRHDGASGVLITAGRETLAAAHDAVREIAASPPAPAVVVLLSGHHRSLDRARLLRDGADEALSWATGAPELLQRLGTALSRGHAPAAPDRVHTQAAVPLNLAAAAGPKVRAALTQALTARPPVEPPARWAMLVLTPRPRASVDSAGRSDLVKSLEAEVRTAIRTADSDRAVAADDSVSVYLHEAAVRDAETVAHRIRVHWRAGKHGPLRVQIFPDEGSEAPAVTSTAARKSS